MTWQPDTPAEMIATMTDVLTYDGYFETCSEDTEVLLAYIHRLERDSRELEAWKYAEMGERYAESLAKKLAAAGALAFKLKISYEVGRTDWKAIYGSAG